MHTARTLRWPRPPRRLGAALEFLPAALEIRDTPPSLRGRLVVHAILLLLVLALLWAWLGVVDVVAVARGQVIPSGRSKIVQSADPGVVRRLHVREGQRVLAGDPLLTLDGAELAAERARVAGELAAERLARIGMQALRAMLGNGMSGAANPARSLDEAAREAGVRIDAGQRQLQEDLLASRYEEYLRKRDALQRRDGARRAERGSLQAQLRKLERSLPVVSERASAARQLYGRGLLARHQWLEQDLERIATEQELVAMSARVAATDEEIAVAGAELAALAASALRGVLDAIERHRRNAAGLERELQRLDERAARLELRAPIDGTVQQLTVRSEGAVVRPAEALMILVPRDRELEVEALVLNRDVAFVGAGQSAAVKVDAFDFTRYGLLPARVRTLAAEAVEDARSGLVYPARVTLGRNFFDVEHGRIEVAPGMGVQVEIHIGQRRIIDYFLSPLARAARDSMRER